MLLIDNDRELRDRIKIDLFINNASELAKLVEDFEFHYKKKKEKIITQKEFEHILQNAIIYAGRILDAVDTMEDLVDGKEVSENE